MGAINCTTNIWQPSEFLKLVYDLLQTVTFWNANVSIKHFVSISPNITNNVHMLSDSGSTNIKTVSHMCGTMANEQICK
jgi:hypothetical protein